MWSYIGLLFNSNQLGQLQFAGEKDHYRANKFFVAIRWIWCARRLQLC